MKRIRLKSFFTTRFIETGNETAIRGNGYRKKCVTMWRKVLRAWVTQYDGSGSLTNARVNSSPGNRERIAKH